MFTIAEENTNTLLSLFSALPERIANAVSNLDTDNLLELRLRTGGILSCVYLDGSYCIDKRGNLTKNPASSIIVTEKDIKRAMELITSFSMYAFESQIRCGYVTLPYGHRVGICGDAETNGGKISHLKSIQSLNYRFSRELIGVSNNFMDEIYASGEIKNTLLVSPPMCGKTTLLRDIARNLSLLGKRVSIVDERGEIAAITNGKTPFDLGLGCDVLSGVSKTEGMLFMLRSMSPDVIITDEIGAKEDLDTIREIKKRGVSVITSLHGNGTILSDFDTVIHLPKLKND